MSSLSKPVVAAAVSLFLLNMLAVPAWCNESPLAAQETETAMPSTALPQIPSLDKSAEMPLAMPNLLLNVQEIKLDSKVLSKKFKGFTVTMQNTSPKELMVNQIDIQNDVTGREAYKTSKKSLIGITSVLGVTGFVTTALRQNWRNKKAQKNIKQFEPIPANFPIPAGQSMTVKALIPKAEQHPEIMVSYSDSETGQNFVTTHNIPTPATGNLDIPVVNPAAPLSNTEALPMPSGDAPAIE